MFVQVLVTMAACAIGYFLTKLYHARMLFIERKRLGMVSTLNTGSDPHRLTDYRL